MQIYLPIAEMPVSILLVLAMGAAVGFISGMFGVGGGFLLTPLLIFLGIPPSVAVATVTAQIAASSTTGALGYWRRHMIDLKLAGFLILGGLVGTALGVLFFNGVQRAGQLEMVITLSYMALFLAVGGLMLVDGVRATLRARQPGIARRRSGGMHPAWAKLPLRVRFPRSGLYLSVIPVLGFAALIGFVGAVLGIGGGFLVVPALLYLFRVPAAVVVGTSLVQILATMTAATVFHAVTNQSVDIVLAALLIVGGTAGAQFGARAGQNLKAESFRLLLAVLLLAVGVRFAIEATVKPEEPFSLTVQAPR
jgi:uncharacterized membrane protein YfcA